LKISDIRLNEKHGGKSGVWTHPEFSASQPAPLAKESSAVRLTLEGVRAAVITISDRASRGETEDKSGPALSQGLESRGASVVGSVIVADDREQIQNAFRRFALESDAQLVISTGGTGLSPRDVTPEALSEICERQIPGFGEALRADGAKHIASAYLSRSMAGTLRDKLLIALPGSPKAVVEGLETLAPLLKHSLHTLRGGDHAVR
jgi:molybdenum cofactor synthesis domain-containing protein